MIGPDIVIVVQARMGSSRLPGKIALQVGGKTLLTFLLHRLKTELPYPIVVATSENPLDDKTVELARSSGVIVVRGSEDDVFSRFQKVAKVTAAKHLVRITADDPLVDTHIIKSCIHHHLEHLPDLTSTREINAQRQVIRYIPKGHSVDILKSETLLSISADGLDSFQKEHVIPIYYTDEKRFKVDVIKNLMTEKPLVSVDTHHDYDNLLKEMYSEEGGIKSEFRIKHTGFVVRNIRKYLEQNVISQAGDVIYDPVQDADVCFIEDGCGSVIELIEPKTERSMTWNFLMKSGGGIHHVCYGADSIESVEKIIREKKMRKILGPVEAKALGCRWVVFAYTRNRELVEFEIG